MAADPANASELVRIASGMTVAQAGPCPADFTLNGQHDNLEIAIGATVTLQADDAQATRYQWEIVGSSSSSADLKLTGDTQAQATLLVLAPGAYVIQLAVEKGESNAVLRRLLRVSTPQRESRLPATGEPLRFAGDEAQSELPAMSTSGWNVRKSSV